MEKKQFDVVVIGGGPGGYPAAIRAAQHGKSVALIEAKELGGTCLNRGCIPSKTLIAGAELWHRIHEASEFGITVTNPTFDYSKMIDRKNRIVAQLRQGVEGLVAANKIKLFKGFGKLISPHEVKITGQDNDIIEAKNIIIASGSEPRNISAFPFDYEKIHDSTSLLNLSKLPKSIVIIGGGIIGCEFASLYALLGVKVTIVELLPRIIPMEDKLLSDALEKAFKKKGVNIHVNAQVAGIDKTKDGVSVKLKSGETFDAEIALVAVGRALNTDSIGLDKAGIAVDAAGLVPVNSKMQTEVPGIYAIGDISTRWWLAHVATHQGLVAADNACGHHAEMDYRAVPSVIFTHPEIATVGLTQENALKQGYKAKIGAFPFQALGKSRAAFHTEGFAQIVFDQKTGQLLGAQVIGHEASTLISEMTVAIANELTIECLAETIHAHPTVAEVWLEAAYMGLDLPVHLPKKSKAS